MNESLSLARVPNEPLPGAATRPGRAWLLVTDVAHAAQVEAELAGEGWQVELRVTRLQYLLMHLHCEAAPPDVLVCGLNFDDSDVFRLMRLLSGDARAPALFITAWQQQAVLKSAAAMAQACKLKLAGSVERPAAAGQIAQALNAYRLSAHSGVRPAVLPLPASELRAMLQWDRMQAWLQPQLRLPGREIVGVKAVLRGVTEDGTLLTSAQLLPSLQRHKLLEAATLALLRQTCDFLVSCLEAQQPLEGALRVSLHSLSDASFCNEMQTAVRRSGLEPGAVTLLISEHDLSLADLPTVIENVARCRMLGFKLGVDGFGTASASLVQLAQLPFTEIRIDPSIVARIETDATRQVIVGSCVGLARGLGLRVVAQGVETVSQLRAVQEAGCTEAQGDLLARPMSVEGLRQWLSGVDQRQAPAAAWTAAMH
jgi:EAL domain-containing protein (putative c-di-GMP-specific phosphodiesterase class I)